MADLIDQIRRAYGCRAIPVEICGPRWSFQDQGRSRAIPLGIPHRIRLGPRLGLVVYAAAPLSAAILAELRRLGRAVAEREGVAS